MDVEKAKEWVTLAGAVIAALTGIWNLLARGKRDNFRVGFDTVSPSIQRETMLHVVSRSDHPIKLTDWGFIEADGRFSSLPMEIEAEGASFGESVLVYGSSELATRGASFETGYTRDDAAGVYAKSITQRLPRVCFDPRMPFRLRLRIRLRLLFAPAYLAWSG